MTTIPTWLLATIALLALPMVILIAGAVCGGAWSWLCTAATQGVQNLRHEAMLRRERRKGNYQTFMHD